MEVRHIGRNLGDAPPAFARMKATLSRPAKPANRVPAATPSERILLDMNLPVMDRREPSRHLRAFGSKIPIAALTTPAMEVRERKGKAAGGHDHDTKPVELPRLLGKWRCC